MGGSVQEIVHHLQRVHGVGISSPVLSFLASNMLHNITASNTTWLVLKEFCDYITHIEKLQQEKQRLNSFNLNFQSNLGVAMAAKDANIYQIQADFQHRLRKERENAKEAMAGYKKYLATEETQKVKRFQFELTVKDKVIHQLEENVRNLEEERSKTEKKVAELGQLQKNLIDANRKVSSLDEMSSESLKELRKVKQELVVKDKLISKLQEKNLEIGCLLSAKNDFHPTEKLRGTKRNEDLKESDERRTRILAENDKELEKCKMELSILRKKYSVKKDGYKAKRKKFVNLKQANDKSFQTQKNLEVELENLRSQSLDIIQNDVLDLTVKLRSVEKNNDTLREKNSRLITELVNLREQESQNESFVTDTNQVTKTGKSDSCKTQNSKPLKQSKEELGKFDGKVQISEWKNNFEEPGRQVQCTKETV